MSDTTVNPERLVEDALRAILGPLDRHLDRVNRGFALALIVLVPGVFLGLWLSNLESGRRSLGWATGVFGLVVLLGIGWDYLIARLARSRFNRRFPPGTTERDIALRILSEMATPNKAEEKLRDVLASDHAERVVRHRRNPVSEETVSFTAQAETTTTGPGAPRPGGYYDYIPLEPRVETEQQERKA